MFYSVTIFFVNFFFQTHILLSGAQKHIVQPSGHVSESLKNVFLKIKVIIFMPKEQ